MNIDPNVNEKVVMDLICQRAHISLRSALLSALPSLPDFDALIALGSSLERALPQPSRPDTKETKEREAKVGQTQNSGSQNQSTNNNRRQPLQRRPPATPAASNTNATGQQQQSSAPRIVKCTRCQAVGHYSSQCTASAPVPKPAQVPAGNKPEKVTTVSTPSGNDKQ